MKRPRGRPRKVSPEQTKEIGRRAQYEDAGYLAAEFGITKRYVYMIQAAHLKRQAEGGVE